jgi:pectin lyase
VGSSATIKGKGLRLEGVSNVIVRNITLAEINAQLVWGGDALDMNGADRVWIDHNRFWRIGRQMIVTHFAGARNVTFSWNDFDGTTPYSSNCNNTHYWVMLILGADTRVTLTNNWVHDFAGRSPHAGGNGAKVAMHLANNYFQRGTGHAADPGTTDVKLLFEGNYYKDVVEPIKLDGMPPGYVFAPIAPISSATLTACQTKLGRACVINQANPMPASNGGFQLDSQVLDTFSQVPRGALLLPYPVDKVPSVVPHLAGPGHI